VAVDDKLVPVALGDVVVPEYLHYSEFIKLVGGDRLHRYFPYDQPSATIRDRFAKAANYKKTWLDRRDSGDREQFTPKVILDASLAAGEKLLGDPSSAEQQQVVDFFTDAVAVDMESIAAARATYDARISVDYNPRLLVIRGISDFVGADAIDNVAQRERWGQAAARSAAGYAHDVIESFLTTWDPRP
jgi:nucleoside phosphorylase